MNSEIICVGTELLMGDVVNTNAAYIASQLAALGINCFFQTVVGDNEKRLTSVLETALERSDLIIMTGGLGPTYDDLTKEVVAKATGRELKLDSESMVRLEAIFKKSERVMTDNNRKQAYIPVGAIALTNDWGTAPGVLIEDNNKVVIMLPGPPTEMRNMFEARVIPYLEAKREELLVSHRVYLFGIGESTVESMLSDDMLHFVNPTIAPYAAADSLHLRITAKAKTNEEAETLIKPVIDKVSSLFSEYVFSIDIPTLEAAMLEKMRTSHKTLAIAETCTAGLLSERVTQIPGSSEVFKGSIIAYSNDMKEALLGVSDETIRQNGAVSEAVVMEMLTGLEAKIDADVYVAMSGIAGPDGGTEDKPIGTVYIAVKTENNLLIKKFNLGRGYRNDRDRIRMMSASHALKMIIDSVDEV